MWQGVRAAGSEVFLLFRSRVPGRAGLRVGGRHLGTSTLHLRRGCKEARTATARGCGGGMHRATPVPAAGGGGPAEPLGAPPGSRVGLFPRPQQGHKIDAQQRACASASGPGNAIISHFLMNFKIPKRQVKMDFLLAGTKYCIIHLASSLKWLQCIPFPPIKK